MLHIPANYEQINQTVSHYVPYDVKVCDNKTYGYWFNALLEKTQSVIEFENLPNTWRGDVKDFLYYCLFKFGYVATFKSSEFGNSFQPATLNGMNFYYQPSMAVVSNSALNSALELEIGKDCELIKLTPFYKGIWDLIGYYAEKLSSLDTAINMSIINNKVPFILGAKNKPMAQMLKKIMDKVNGGEPLVIYDEIFREDGSKIKSGESPFSAFDRDHLKNSYITTEQLQDFQTILNSFYNEIGIPTVPYQKMERMVDKEASSQEKASSARLSVWYDCLEESFVKVNALLGTNIKVSLRFKNSMDGGEKNELSESDNNRI